MKSRKIYLLSILAVFIIALSSCEQEQYEPNLSVASGGGTVTTYKAYTLASTGAQNIYGRVVFWKDNSGNTLVQMGLYNTAATLSYSSAIFSGTTSAPGAQLIPLSNVDGASGSFGTVKFYVISDKKFFDNLNTYNANVRISSGATIVASGNIGVNAEPVEEVD